MGVHGGKLSTETQSGGAVLDSNDWVEQVGTRLGLAARREIDDPSHIHSLGILSLRHTVQHGSSSSQYRDQRVKSFPGATSNTLAYCLPGERSILVA